MDAESPRSRQLGCWDGLGATLGLVTLAGDIAPAHDFKPGSEYCDFLMDIGFGKTVDQKTKDFWADAIETNYSGDAGKKRICQAAVNLASRDGLHEQLSYIRCPVLWLQVCGRDRPACPVCVLTHARVWMMWFSALKTQRKKSSCSPMRRRPD